MLATQLLDAGLVQDIYLTTAPGPGATGTPMYPKPLKTRTVVRKTSTGAEQGVVVEHLKIDGA